MQFYNSGLLLLLLLIPVLLALLVRSRYRSRKRFASFADEHILGHYLQRISPFNSTMKQLLLIAALGFVVLGLVRPQWDHELSDLESQGLDLIFCLDISRSMDASDLAPSRLERAKLQIHSLLDRMQGDRVGIIAFAGAATLECPLTDDYESVRMVLNSLNTQSAVKTGTDLGEAFSLAEKAFDTSSGSNILVLVSDGEDLEQRGGNRAARLAASGVKIFAIGVGSPEGAVIRHPLSGVEAFTKPDLDFLAKVASEGQGQFYNLIETETATAQIITSIRESSEGKRHGNRVNGLKDQYHFFALMAMLLLIAESLIIPLRRESRSQ